MAQPNQASTGQALTLLALLNHQSLDRDDKVAVLDVMAEGSAENVDKAIQQANELIEGKAQ